MPRFARYEFAGYSSRRMTLSDTESPDRLCFALPRPIAGRYLIRRDPPDDRAKFLEIPQNCRKQQMSGVILRAGPSRNGSPAAREGDRVLFPLRAWETTRWNGEELLFVNESDLIAVIA